MKVVGLDGQLAAGCPFVVAANHGHYADGLVLGTAFGCPEHVHTFVARGTLRWGGGIGALCLGPSRTVCVDLDRGASAFRTGVRLLTEGQALLVFPEGWAHMDGHREPFKRGAVAMARQAAAQRHDVVHVVPMSIRYPKHPGRWILKWPPVCQYAFTLIAFPWFRRGAIVAIGPPIDARDLPADSAAATRVFEGAIADLIPPGTSTGGFMRGRPTRANGFPARRD